MEDFIYMYGQVMASHSFLLEGEFPKIDTCGLIDESHFHVGGETGTAAAILASLGCKIKIAGSHLGTENANLIREYFNSCGVDTSELVFDETFHGVIDYVFIAGNTRTVFGEWGKLNRRKDWYESVSEDSIRECKCVGFDPLLDGSDLRVVEYCRKYQKKYATIDCAYDSEYSKHCEINVVSHEFMDNTYGEDVDYEQLHRKYTENSDGLIIFTFGGKKILYGRKGEAIKEFHPYHVNVVSTLGAGDSFKAGTIYGLYQEMSDDDLIRYASAVAGIAITKYPISENPPTLREIEELIHCRNE